MGQKDRNSGADNRGLSLKKSGLIAALLFLLIIICLYDFSNINNTKTKEMVTNHLIDVSLQAAAAVELKLDSYLEEVSYAADILSKAEFSGDNEKMTAGMLEELREHCQFARIRIVDRDGSVRGLNGEKFEGSSGYVESVLAGKSGITEEFKSAYTNENVFVIYAPLMENGKSVGGIAGVLVVDDLVDIVSFSGFQGRSYNYVIDQTGHIIIQTDHPDRLYEGRDYFSFLKNEAQYLSMRPGEVAAKMQRGESAVLYCSVGQKERLLVFTPLSFNGWYVATGVSSEAASFYASQMKKNALQLTVKITGIFLALFCLIAYWSYRSWKEVVSAKEELEVSNKKFQLAIKHTSSLLFDYSIVRDKLEFISGDMANYDGLPRIVANLSADIFAQGLLSDESRDEFQSLIGELREGGSPVFRELRGGRCFGKDTWLLMSMTSVKNGKGEAVEAIGILRDITEDKNNRIHYAREEQFRAAILSEALAVWSVDLLNKKFITCTVNGRNRDEKNRGERYYDKLLFDLSRLVHPDDRERIKNFLSLDSMVASYCAGVPETREIFRMRLGRGGSYRWIRCRLSLLREPVDGNPVAFAYMKDIDLEKKREMTLMYSSERDHLTGLYNRKAMEDKVSCLLKENSSGLSYMLMMDLDGFKEVNDRHGHQLGDEVLREMGSLLESAFRSQDLVSRLGGDEFLAFVEGVPSRDYALSRAQEVRRRVGLMDLGRKKDIELSVSIGISFAPEDGLDFDTLYRKADQAMYKAKRKGKNCVAMYEDDEESLS